MPIYLDKTLLEFDFTQYHQDARVSISFGRTMRVPQLGGDYPLPPSYGMFPLEHVDDYPDQLPPNWVSRGGVLMPMYQADAMWIAFSSTAYPIALKIGLGNMNCITGERWDLCLKAGDRFTAHAERLSKQYLVVPQDETEHVTQVASSERYDGRDYLTLLEQPMLDGVAVEPRHFRHFVANPLGHAYPKHYHVSGAPEWDGLQLVAYPLRREIYDEWQATFATEEIHAENLAEKGVRIERRSAGCVKRGSDTDLLDPDNWETGELLRCFLSIININKWTAITGRLPPTKAFEAAEYARAEIPWFPHYEDTPISEDSDERSDAARELVPLEPITRVIKRP